MRNAVKILILLFFLPISAYALYSDSSRLTESARNQLIKFQKNLSGHDSVDTVSDATNDIREKVLNFCSKKNPGVMSENIEGLLKVGLHNYCDQYSNTEKFCSCIGSISQENTLDKDKYDEFEKKLKKENLKNLALTSMKSLTDFKSLKLAAFISAGGEEGSVKGGAVPTCDSEKEFVAKIQPICSDEKLAKLRSAYQMYTDECDDCQSTHKLQNIPKDGRFNRLSQSEKFIALAGHAASSEVTRLHTSDYFKTSTLSKHNGADKRFKTITEVYEYALLDEIADRLFNKFNQDPNKTQAEKSVSYTKAKYMDYALIDSIHEYAVFKNDPAFKKLKRPGIFMSRDSSGDQINEYLKFFSGKIISNFAMNTKELSKKDIRELLKKEVDKQYMKNKVSSCEKAVETFKSACKAIDDEEAISFDFKSNPQIFRDRNYGSEDKFTFDQMYCVSQDYSNSDITGRIFFKYGGVKQRNNLLSYDLGTGDDIDDYDYMQGLQEDKVFSLKYNTKQRYQFVDIPSLGYDVLPSLAKKPAYESESVLTKNSSGTGYELKLKTSGPQPQFGFDAKKLYSRGPSLLDSLPPQSQTELLVGTIASTIREEEGFTPDDLNEQMRQEMLREMERSNKRDLDINANSIFEKSARANGLTPPPQAPVAQPSAAPGKAIIIPEDNIALKTVEDETGEVSRPEQSSSETSEQNSQKQYFAEAEGDINSKKMIKGEDIEYKGNSEFSPKSKNAFMSAQSNELFQNDYLRSINENIKAAELKKKEKEKLLAEQKTLAELSKQSGVSTAEDSSVTATDLEVQQLKLELEKMKLELAKTEHEVKKKSEQEKISEKKKIVAKKTQLAPAYVEPSRVRQTTKSSSRPKSVSSNNRASYSGPSNSSSPSAQSQRTQARSSSKASSASFQPSSSRQAKATSASSYESGAATSSRRGSLLTATSISNDQIRSSSQTPSRGKAGNSGEIGNYNQEELQDLYEKYGEEILVEGVENSELEKVLLEKNEKTGIVTVQKKVTPKRAPAQVKAEVQEKVERSPRKRFSYDEFKTIIDSSRKD